MDCGIWYPDILLLIFTNILQITTPNKNNLSHLLVISAIHYQWQAVIIIIVLHSSDCDVHTLDKSLT